MEDDGAYFLLLSDYVCILLKKINFFSGLDARCPAPCGRLYWILILYLFF